MCVPLQHRLALTRSAPPHGLCPPPHPAPLGRGAVALHIVPPVHMMLHALKWSAAVQTVRVTAAAAAATAAAAICGDCDVESSLALAVVEMKGSRRPFLVHERLGFIHWQRASL